MEMIYRYYLPSPFSKPYIVTIAMSKVDGKTHVGVAYQGKRDGYNKEDGDSTAINRMNRNPQILDPSKHYNLNSAIFENMPKHIKRCIRIFDKQQYHLYKQKVAPLEKQAYKIFMGLEK